MRGMALMFSTGKTFFVRNRELCIPMWLGYTQSDRKAVGLHQAFQLSYLAAHVQAWIRRRRGAYARRLERTGARERWVDGA